MSSRVFVFLFLLIRNGSSENLWCYSCVSTQPGCGEYLDWRIHHAITCPNEDDKCVKIIESRGAESLITRDCLSSLEGLRKDIPADSYEGCRPAAQQPKTGVYVQNNVKQLEIKRDYWRNVTYCFCDFDQWCNGGKSIHVNSVFNIFISMFMSYVILKIL